MCGICGIVRFPELKPADVSAAERMAATMRHRGPDGIGAWSDGCVAFGHTRLSIIDIAGGHQPMFNERGDVAVTFNGEIYNFLELREQLVRAGHQFRSRSDTEVVVHGYEEWGEGVLDRLRGMFALAVWDGARERLVLARDRVGEKPLYYHAPSARTLVFASEVKALLAHPEVPRAVNDARLGEYLVFRSVSGAQTLFEGIVELPPATLMVVDRDGARQRRYWHPAAPLRATSPDAAIATGRDLLVEAVRLRLVSDVPLGTITSGGLDSSLLSAIAAELSPQPLDTFCVGFADPAFDERPYARLMSDRIGARFHEIEVSAADIDRELDALTWAHDEPLTHPNSIPMHLLFRYAKEEVGVTVLLSGEGADELFGGYDWYRAAHRRRHLRHLAPLRHLLPPAGRRLAVLRKVLHPDYLLAANGVSSLEEVAALRTTTGALGSRRELWPADRDDVDGLFLYDQQAYLPPLLQRQDRMSMAAGVEARVVFLDHLLMEWANSLPAAVKTPGGERKWLLKRIAERWIPSEILTRRKVGFTLPLGAWLRPGGPLAYRLEALRDPSAFARGVVRPARLEQLLDEHARGAADHADLLWSLLALETWATTFLGPEPIQRELPGACTGIAAAASSTAGVAAAGGPRG